jgi:acetyltransferase-like isoleucine patch superfamily enzyme
MAETGRDKFKKFKGIISFLTAFFSLFPTFILTFLFTFFRNKNGKSGLLIRYILLRNLSKSCGDNVSIQPNVFLFNLHLISFGNNVSIHPMCYLDGAGEIEIGDNVSIAHSSSILTTNHTWNEVSIPIKYNKETFSKVTVENDVWIGCGCRILSGVTLRQRSVIAAGAVVTSTVESNSVYGGIPAKLIKKINE